MKNVKKVKDLTGKELCLWIIAGNIWSFGLILSAFYLALFVVKVIL